MRKKLLFILSLTIMASTLHAQVTQINNNRSLQASLAINATKTIFASETDSSIWVSEGTLATTIQLSATIKHEASAGVLSSKLIFRGSDGTNGAELFISDGTPAGTTLLKDINAGTASSSPADFVVLNGMIYFSAQTIAEGRELWRTDGTASGTTLVKDIVAGAGSSNLANNYEMFSNGNFILFAVNTAAEGLELWKSDGTNAGTTLLKDIYAGADSSKPRDFFPLNSSTVLFLAANAAAGDELWKTDGTTAGTVLVKDILTGPANSTSFEIAPGFSFQLFGGFHKFNNRAYFVASDGTSIGQVWGTDGTTANTTLLKDIAPGFAFNYLLLVDAVDYPDKFIFPVADGVGRSELWQSDGTPAGTVLFKSFDPITPGDLPFIAVPFSVNASSGTFAQSLFQGNKFFFIAGTQTEGYEIWISDGTIGGTSMLKDINPGTGDGVETSNLSYLYTTTTAFFAANDGTHGNELWKTDGTAAGTVLVQDINLNANDANPSLYFVNNNKIFFGATDGDDANETDLFVVDGSFTPLPVKLDGITVTRLQNDAVLQWTTSQEINTRNFTLQRSYDAVHFENIGTVAAAGNSTSRNDYSFIDAGAANRGRTIIYYRLLTTDNDGKASVSPVVTLRLNRTQWNVQLLGNPVRNNINLVVTGATTVQLSIKDVAGKPVYSSTTPVVNAALSIPVSNLPNGVYVLTITNGGERKSIKFVK